MVGLGEVCRNATGLGCTELLGDPPSGVRPADGAWVIRASTAEGCWRLGCRWVMRQPLPGDPGPAAPGWRAGAGRGEGGLRVDQVPGKKAAGGRGPDPDGEGSSGPSRGGERRLPLAGPGGPHRREGSCSPHPSTRAAGPRAPRAPLGLTSPPPLPARRLDKLRSSPDPQFPHLNAQH